MKILFDAQSQTWIIRLSDDNIVTLTNDELAELREQINKVQL